MPDTLNPTPFNRGGCGNIGRGRTLKSAESEAREIDRLRTRVAKMSEVSRRITESWDLDAVLQEVVDGARSLTDAQYGAVEVFDDPGRGREFVNSGITPEERQLLGNLSQVLEILGYPNEIREPLRLADLNQHSRSVGFPENHSTMKAFLGAPIRHLGEPVGNIYLTEKEGGGEFSEEDEETLVMFASQAAIVIGNALRYEAERRTSSEMETEGRRLAALVDSSPVGVMVVDAPTRTFASVNKEAERILGMSPQPGSTLVRYHEVAIYRRMDGKQYESHERPLARALDRGEVVRAEEILLNLPNGRTMNILVNATPIYSDDGSIVSAIAVLQDMTPLEEMERLRNEFLAMVSHELRTPLTMIKGCTSTVLDSSSRVSISEFLQYFRMIDDQSDRLRDLVSNLLDMTQIEAGMLSVSPEPTDVESLVDEARTSFIRRGVRNAVEVEIAPRLPLIEADRQRISQVLDNLLSNASKYSPADSTIEISVSLDEFFVAFSVKDEGEGIPADQMSNLFRKFSRIGDTSREEHVAGEGLGLAICKGIVEAHGGRIWAESGGEEHGTRITFTVPKAVDASQQSASNTLAVRQDNWRILAMDDEPQALWLLRNILSDHGYTVFGTSNPDEMMHLLEMEHPHLVLLDLMMPGTSGFDLMTRIRDVSQVPIIFVSANDQEENVANALGMGADDYIVKPYSSTELLARVVASLRKRGAVATPAPRQAYHLGDLTIDYADRSVTISGRPVQLSRTEYRLLFELSTNAGRVLTHSQILQRVWGEGYYEDSQILRAAVKNLRRKLRDDANNPRYVFTEPRVGYLMKKDREP
ncbi:MAG: response regulator [Chloroflexi bacterium]|nr:response regulator [Chloroflexota bacterium]